MCYFSNWPAGSIGASDLVSASTALVTPVIEPEGPSVVSTHLFLSADIADDGVGGRTGRGPQDCHHAFRHNLAHCKKTSKEEKSTVKGLSPGRIYLDDVSPLTSKQVQLPKFNPLP